MRLITTGVDENGKSAVVSTEEFVREPGGSPANKLWNSPVLPPELSYERPKEVDVPDVPVGLERGAGYALHVTLEPDEFRDIHRFHGYSLLMFFSGSAELLLETSTVEIGAGDCVILPAVIHGWRGGPKGAEFFSIGFGLGRP